MEICILYLHMLKREYDLEWTLEHYIMLGTIQPQPNKQKSQQTKNGHQHKTINTVLKDGTLANYC